MRLRLAEKNHRVFGQQGLSGGGRSNSTCAFLEYPTGDRGYIGLETGHSLEAWRPASLL